MIDSFSWWAIGVVCGVASFSAVALLVQWLEKRGDKPSGVHFDYNIPPPRRYKESSLCQGERT